MNKESKAYSNKALPSGTVLREWRLEEVLGVGGFGIVYKGRGIYFDELVAIKEYFPSSISERDAEDTVVPIDSDAEEVHALGLKKFVEEAKLLWNLSTPTRHPNIVSVRSLFEIHGTAYMVMDFEDGVSLSKMLKKGQKFNERSLWNIVQPIAEGLARAHRVGVLHRDIKPPNILITEDSRPVLIDFGSARFEAAEATSTKVTFHTPPYAAIEQYVKTYPQGPWTDIYALGVVLYECITGEKPPEVLERLHAGLGKPLGESKWPGYSKKFLAAVDAAMTIKPNERPQSIAEWLALFGDEHGAATVTSDDDDEKTRFYAHEVAKGDIVPVAPPSTGGGTFEVVETQVPTDPSEVEFKGAGHETGARKKVKTAKEAVAASAAAGGAAAEAMAEAQPKPAKGGQAAAEVKPDRTPPLIRDKAPAASGAPSDKRKMMIAGSGALAVIAAAAIGWSTLGGDNGSPSEALPDLGGNVMVAPPVTEDVSSIAPAVKALADEARNSGAPESAVNGLLTASEAIATQAQQLPSLSGDQATNATNQIKQAAITANLEFTRALLRDAESRASRLGGTVPWANVNRANAARSVSADRQAVAGRLRAALAGLRAAAAAQPADPAASVATAREALLQSGNFASAAASAYRLGGEQRTEATPSGATTKTVAPAASSAVTNTAASAASSSTSLSPAKTAQFNAIVDSGRSMARQVLRFEKSGTPAQKENAKLARNYDRYLVNLKDSFRGVTSDREADRLIGDARKTNAYLTFLVKQSNAQ
ncbi:MAG TPA: protein kinase [Sphingomicrobium sp.]|nr:protein kinase [Sphingomicrobium sp.]